MSDTDLTFREIIETRHELADGETVEIDLGGNYTLEVGRDRIGIIRMVHKPTKEDPFAVVPRLVADFAIWLPAVRNTASVSRDGRIIETKTALFYPEVIRGKKRFTLHHPMTDGKTAYSLSSLRPLFHRAGIELPLDPTDKAKMENLISSLGVDDGSREEGHEVEAMGWGDLDGEWTYMAPRGSVTRNGIVQVRVSSPGAEGEEDALPEVLNEIGFDRVLDGDELDDAADAIQSYIDIMVDGHSAAYLALGTLFTAPLPQPEQCALSIVGKTGTGKSHLAKTLMLFTSTSLDATGDLTGKPSLPGLSARAVWSRHGVCLWDDYRVDDAREDPDLRKNTTALIQMHQSGVDAPKSNVSRGVAKSRLVRAFGVLTSEEVIGGGEGIANRLLITTIAEGDVLVEPLGSAPLDRFRNDFGHSGVARALYGTYLQWLAGKITEAGGLRAFEIAITARRNDLVSKLKTSRTMVSAGKLLVGWSMFREFATEHGFEDKLPDTHTVEAAILGGANEADIAAGEANPMHRIIERVSEKIAAGSGYIASESNDAPTGWNLLGWRKEPGQGIRPVSGNAPQIGKIGDANSEYTVLNLDALWKIASEEHIGTSRKALMDMARKLPFVHQESFTEGGTKPKVPGFKTRPRGLYVRTTALVSQWGDEAALARRASVSATEDDRDF